MLFKYYNEKSTQYHRQLLRRISARPRRALFGQAVGFALLFLCSLFLLHLHENLRRTIRGDTSKSSATLIELESPIPRKIWQIHLPRKADSTISEQNIGNSLSWLAKNPDYTYTLVGLPGANRFIDEQFRESPWIRKTFHALSNPGSKSDLLRYLLLLKEGGVYTDTDTTALKAIDEWVPTSLQTDTRLIVGIEWDGEGTRKWMDIQHDVQFCQWTIAASPGHRVFTIMVDRAVSMLEEISRKHNTTMAEMKFSSPEVMNSTGPAGWTDAVMQYLQEELGPNFTWRNLTGMERPSLFADVLFLPIDGFGMGQPHSHSTNNGSIPDSALVKHHFRGSWRWD